MTYADKYDARKYSTYRFYRDIRRKVGVNAQIGRLYPNFLDHVVFDDDDIDSELIAEVAESYLVDDAAASIQRFASRCLAADKSESMVMMISQALIDSDLLPKPILDVLSFYGAKLDLNRWNYFSRACLCGVNDGIKQAIENGRNVGEYDAHAAIISGNIDVIKLVVSAYRWSVSALSVEPINLLNATVQSMELLSLNIIQRGKHSKFYNIPSFGVLQWILDHDVMEHDDVLIDIAFNASRYSGHYFDMLRYLIEQRNITVPRDVLAKLDLSQATDLDVLDYLLLHGADVIPVDQFGWNVLERFPTLIRYWLDKGFVIQSDDANTLFKCVRHNMTAPVLEMMIDKYSMDVNADEYGDTALHWACQLNNYEVVEMLLRHGADVNKRNGWMKTSYDWTSDDRIKQLLIQYGYRV